MEIRWIDALQAKMGTLSVEAQAKLEQEAVKKEAKAAAKAEAAEKKKMVRCSYSRFVHSELICATIGIEGSW
jgi:hypothetical protein